MRISKYLPNENLLQKSQSLRDDYNLFVRKLVHRNKPIFGQRYEMAEKYLQNCSRGIEIGAFHFPNHLPLGSHADYVDQLSIDALKERFPEMNDLNLVYPFIIDDGQRLSKIPSETYDFLIANHMIEHVEDFFTTIQNHLRVIKPHSIIIYTVPDKRFTFDVPRQITTYDHLKNEYLHGYEVNRKEHHLDFLQNVSKLSGEELTMKISEALQNNLDTHFHVWTMESFAQHIQQGIQENLINAELLEVVPNGIEFICILRKL